MEVATNFNHELLSTEPLNVADGHSIAFVEFPLGLRLKGMSGVLPFVERL